MNEEKLRVLVVDDHPIFAQSLATALDTVDVVDHVCWATSREEALGILDEHNVDVALVDLRMPEVDGVDLLAEITARDAAKAVVVLSIAADERSIIRAFEAGAKGFLSKSDHFDYVVWSVLAASRGEVPISPTIFARVLPRLIGENAEHALTAREEVVLEVMSRGHSNAGIAEDLEVSANTVRNHVYNIMRKLDVDTRSEAIAKARLLGLLPAEPT